MQRTYIKEIQSKIGEKVKIECWLHELRDHSKIKFVLLRDVTGIAQAIAPAGTPAYENIMTLPRESVLTVFGTVKAESQAPGGVELLIESYEVLSLAERLPIPVVEKGDETSLPKRLDWRWIDLRKPECLLAFKAWTAFEAAMREFLVQQGFIQIHSPKLMGSPSESGAELFGLEYFGKKAFLAQSPQFYKQMAMAAGFEKVFEVGPVFRANPSHTTRHDTEFTSFDLEMSFIESHEEVMCLEEELLAYALGKLKEQHGQAIEETFGVTIAVPKTPFPRLTLSQARELIGKPQVDRDLDPEEERAIYAAIKEKYGHEFVFITGYPPEFRAFYHMRDEKGMTKSFDLLYKGVEVTTGAQREHHYEQLKAQALERGMSLEPLEDYLNFFRFGCPPHGGLGFGLSRMVMLILERKNVREVTFLPRDPDRLRP